jgi:hypothetical protein
VQALVQQPHLYSLLALYSVTTNQFCWDKYQVAKKMHLVCAAV